MRTAIAVNCFETDAKRKFEEEEIFSTVETEVEEEVESRLKRRGEEE